MPPAGRPRTAAHRDLPPRLIRRTRGGSVRYYYQHPDGQQQALGGDLDAALKAWADMHTSPAIKGSFNEAATEFLEHGIKGKSIKTQKEYTSAITRLRGVFGDSSLASIRPKHIGELMHVMRNTPVQANRIKAALSRLWNWSRSRGITDLPNPCTGIDGYSETSRKLLVDADMYFAIFDRADQVLKDWMQLDIIIGQRVTDITRIHRTDIVTDADGKRALRYRSTKTGTLGLMAIDGDLAALIDELLKRKRKATGPHLLQTQDGQAVTYAMLRKRFDAAREKAKRDLGDAFADWQMRDLRKTSLNQAATLEEARRRALHTDARTTARHYEVLIDARPGGLPTRKNEPEKAGITDKTAGITDN